MASSRNSTSLNNAIPVEAAFERALGEIRARVCVFEGSTGGNDGLMVGYSGGLDSTVLLHLAAAWGRRTGLRVEAMHVHHGLSGNADAWAAHCERVCQMLGVPLHVARVAVHGEGQGMEAAARLARYAALGEHCRIRALPLLLTAHHRDDQAETVLPQLLRGAGVAGLAAMRAVLQAPALIGRDVALGRPLLELSRAQLQQWADEQHLQWIHDESNDDVRYRRNAVRNQLLPALEQVAPEAAVLLARTAQHMQSAQTLLEDLACLDLEHCASGEEGGLAIEPMLRLSAERVDNLLRYWLAKEQAGTPTTAQPQVIREQMLQAQPDQHPLFALARCDLRRSAGKLLLCPKEAALQPAAVELAWTGEEAVEVPAWGGRLLFQHSASNALPEALLREHGLQLCARSGSERLQIAANRPSRSLENLYQEAGIPAWRRPALPLVYAGGQLVAAAGIGMNWRALQPGPGLVLHWESDPA